MTPPHHRDEYGAIRFAVSNRRVLLAVAVVLAVAACGWAYLQTGAPGWLAAALAVAVAIVAMQMTRSLHPPGGATALIAVAGSPAIHDLGFVYPLFPVGVGAIVLVVVAVAFNNLATDARWPIFWY